MHGEGPARRQLRLRVLEALEARVKGFQRREELWPLRVPHEPLLLAELIESALPDEDRLPDPATLRSRPLLSLSWEDGSSWEAWVIVLPSRIKLYCDSGEQEHRVLASGGRNEGDESDRAFLQLLAESAGAHFGIEMSGGAPSQVRSAVTDREFLAGFFVELFEVIGAEASVRRQLHEDGRRTDPAAEGRDFQLEVERWLDGALSARRSPAPGRRH